MKYLIGKIYTFKILTDNNSTITGYLVRDYSDCIVFETNVYPAKLHTCRSRLAGYKYDYVVVNKERTIPSRYKYITWCYKHEVEAVGSTIVCYINDLLRPIA